MKRKEMSCGWFKEREGKKEREELDKRGGRKAFELR